METLLQVVTEEPVPLRRLNLSVPRDLETICHKCLHRTPRGRYTSAQELADDLGRFLRGEPVKARPVGAMERGLRWMRRNPVISVLVAAVVLTLTAGLVASWWLTAWAVTEKLRADERTIAEADAKRKAVIAERKANEQLRRAESLVYSSKLALGLGA